LCYLVVFLQPMITYVFIWLFPLFALLMTVCAQIRIVSPDVLSHEFEANHGMVYGTTATFGAPYYGERVMGQLVYGESKLGLAHCTDDDYDLPLSPHETPPNLASESLGKHGTYARRELVNVVLVHRGQCTFVTKAKVAQAKHAHAVIVVDHSNKPTEEVQKIIMADDGHGFDVRIPSVMVSAQDGLKLEQATKQYGVVVELVWDIPRGEVVVVDFWMSSASEETSSFLKRFQDSAELLRNLLQFTPHYQIFTLPAEVGRKANLCFEGKEERYCAPDPDGDGPVTGADVAYEDLRQLCLWRTTAKSAQGAVPPVAADGTSATVLYSKEFWDYVAQLPDDCPVNGRSPEHRFGSPCNSRLLESFGLGILIEVQECMETNLDKYLMHEVVDTAWSAEALRVNGWRYSGPLDPETVLKAICHAFIETPSECAVLLSGYGPMFLPSLISLSSFVLSIVLVVALAVCACHGYKQLLRISMRTSLRQEIGREVETQMAEYAPLTQDCNRETSTRAPTLNF